MLTINVPNLPAPPATKFDLTSTGFTFNASVGDESKNIPSKSYSFSLDFFDEIDVEASKTHLNSKCLYAVLRKKQAKDEYWPRLTKDKVRLHNVKTDFDKWVDEDEQNDVEEDLSGGAGGMGGMNMDPAMLGAGGAGGLDLQSMMALAQGDMGNGLGDLESQDGTSIDADEAEEDARSV